MGSVYCGIDRFRVAPLRVSHANKQSLRRRCIDGRFGMLQDKADTGFEFVRVFQGMGAFSQAQIDIQRSL